MNQIIILTQNLIIILGFMYVFSLVLPRINALKPQTQHYIVGIVFGIFGILNLILAVTISPGVINDIRNPIVIVSAIIGGYQSAIITTLFVAVYRYLVVGGIGALPATVSIIFVLTLGLAYRRFVIQKYHFRWFNLLLLGFASVWIAVLTTIIMLPADIYTPFLESFIPSASLLYPLATLLFGSLYQHEQRHIRTTEQLKQSEARFKAIFNQTFQFVGLLEPSGNVLEANDTALAFAGLSQQDVIGKPFWDIIWWQNSPETQARLQNAIKQASTGEFVRYHEVVLGQKGQSITIDFSLKPIFNSQQEVILLIPEGRDITHEILAQQQRIELNVERERIHIIQAFINDAGHHFKTPISVLNSSLHLFTKTLEKIWQSLTNLNDNLESTELTEAQKDAQQISNLTKALEKRVGKFEGSVTSINHLVDDLLEIVELTNLTLHNVKAQAINTTIHNVVSSFENTTREAKLTLQSTITQTPIAVRHDANLIRILLDNLIRNAIHYTPANGYITVTLTQDKTNAILIIQDTGIGIASEDLDLIFERFYRGDNAQKLRSSGSGLGMAIVEQIVTLHKGTISVDSTIGEGTIFTIKFPLSPIDIPVLD